MTISVDDLFRAYYDLEQYEKIIISALNNQLHITHLNASELEIINEQLPFIFNQTPLSLISIYNLNLTLIERIEYELTHASIANQFLNDEQFLLTQQLIQILQNFNEVFLKSRLKWYQLKTENSVKCVLIMDSLVDIEAATKYFNEIRQLEGDTPSPIVIYNQENCIVIENCLWKKIWPAAPLPEKLITTNDLKKVYLEPARYSKIKEGDASVLLQCDSPEHAQININLLCHSFPKQNQYSDDYRSQLHVKIIESTVLIEDYEFTIKKMNPKISSQLPPLNEIAVTGINPCHSNESYYIPSYPQNNWNNIPGSMNFYHETSIEPGALGTITSGFSEEKMNSPHREKRRARVKFFPESPDSNSEFTSKSHKRKLENTPFTPEKKIKLDLNLPPLPAENMDYRELLTSYGFTPQNVITLNNLITSQDVLMHLIELKTAGFSSLGLTDIANRKKGIEILLNFATYYQFFLNLKVQHSELEHFARYGDSNFLQLKNKVEQFINWKFNSVQIDFILNRSNCFNLINNIINWYETLVQISFNNDHFIEFLQLKNRLYNFRFINESLDILKEINMEPYSLLTLLLTKTGKDKLSGVITNYPKLTHLKFDVCQLLNHELCIAVLILVENQYDELVYLNYDASSILKFLSQPDGLNNILVFLKNSIKNDSEQKQTPSITNLSSGATGINSTIFYSV
ncbi:MAG: hypothetical protein Q8M40_02945 [Legionella sp.]|nr:hypothetical protein [Legionella sp.]